MTRPLKRQISTSRDSTTFDNDGAKISESVSPAMSGNSILRSRYLAVQNFISDERDDIGSPDSDKFLSVFNEMESLHQLVRTPREQIVDAEAFLNITNSLVTCVKRHGKNGITPSDFITCVLKDFGQKGGPISTTEGGRDSIKWKNIGVAVSHLFRSCPGCSTMIGPMNEELKTRKAYVRRRVQSTEGSKPEEVGGYSAKAKTDTDKNMATMFNILRKKRCVKLENLILNRNSFAQTVENLFALSFLAKDGRVEITVNEDGCHLVSPRNAADASAVASGEAVYRHFVFRFDFKDWKLMASSIEIGEEVMPDRNQRSLPHNNQQDAASVESQEAGANTDSETVQE